MKNYIFIFFCFSLFTLGCKSDDGFRDVTLEIDSGAIPTSNDPTNPPSVRSYVRLQNQSPDIDLRLDANYFAFNPIPAQTVTSDAVSFSVGSNVRLTYGVWGYDGQNNSLPCDVKIRIKSDNKVIWSYSAKTGDSDFGDDMNLIIR